jgi:hypothetical protein
VQPLAFALALSCVALTGLVTAAALRLRSFVSFLLAAYLLASVEVVLLTEALSLLRLVGARGYAVGMAVWLAGALLLWHRRGHPRPSLPRVELRAAALRNPILAGLAVVVAAALCYELFLVLATPPNNGDSLTYHLTRAAAWLQHEGIYRIPGAEKAPENDYPPNAEIEILFSLAFLRGDAAAALTQFLAQGAAMLAIFGCAQRLGYSRPAALFPALLAPTLSQAVLIRQRHRHNPRRGASESRDPFEPTSWSFRRLAAVQDGFDRPDATYVPPDLQGWGSRIGISGADRTAGRTAHRARFFN